MHFYPTEYHAEVRVPEELQSKVAHHLGLKEEEVEFLSCQYVEWTDSGMGIYEKGKMVLHVITPGYRIVLKTPAGQQIVHTNVIGSCIKIPPVITGGNEKTPPYCGHPPWR